ncbi:hypothetical protein [Novosphingobium guangzhouense]|uniref:LysR family transcriptional regulator n=1 Tax=Novosphingobium guangzhouense TaxID=1850347 RepID=A0A2K2FZB0_9SPHN|nr:hypothetical protein [Novosphingobium guangzhouense]PNU04120.1 hypothetical protein A8V01_05875 [Novosphingobium guangzhouense]
MPVPETVFLQVPAHHNLTGMTQIHAPQPPRRTNADYRWTRTKIHAFVTALARTGEVAAAAREVGMSRQSAYRLRARLGPQFAQVWNEGLAWAEELRQERRFHKVTPPPPQGDTQGDTSVA